MNNGLCLQVVGRWKGTILETRHFIDQKEIVVGPRRSYDFGFPIPNSAREKLVLGHREGDQYSLKTKPESSGDSKLLGFEDEVNIRLGDFEFACRYVPIPPELPKKRIPPEPLFFRMFGISLAFMTALLMALGQMKLPDTVDVEAIPERIATILYQPEKFDRNEQPRDKDADAPAPEAKQEASQRKEKIDIVPGQKPAKTDKKHSVAKARPKAQASGREGPGARAKGAEGTRGSVAAPAHKTPQNVARRPSPERGKGSGGAHSQVAEDGSLDALRGASEKIKDLLGGATARLGKSGEKLKGFGAFETAGSGGLALSQKGRGGGGKSEGLGGTAQFGTAGGRVGVGAGSSGTGSGILSGRGRVDLRQGGPEETVVMGSIDASAIEAAILAHKDEFRLCYEKELNAGRPTLSGRVLPLFVIGSSGRVSRAAVKESSLHNSNVERCVLQVIKRIQFPEPAGGGTVEVTYPFKFRSLGG